MFCNNRFYRTYLLVHAYKLYLIKAHMDNDSESSEGSVEQFRALPNAKSKVWRYFGFPVDSNGAISSKTHVTCVVYCYNVCGIWSELHILYM